MEKKEVPITLLESIRVNLIDGTQVNIDIRELLAEGTDPTVLEEMLNSKLEALDHIVKDVDFYVSIDEVASLVQPITDNFLKDL